MTKRMSERMPQRYCQTRRRERAKTLTEVGGEQVHAREVDANRQDLSDRHQHVPRLNLQRNLFVCVVVTCHTIEQDDQAATRVAHIEELGEDERGEGDGDDVDEFVLEQHDRQHHDHSALIHAATVRTSKYATLLLGRAREPLRDPEEEGFVAERPSFLQLFVQFRVQKHFRLVDVFVLCSHSDLDSVVNRREADQHEREDRHHCVERRIADLLKTAKLNNETARS